MFISSQYQNDIIMSEDGTVTDYLGIEPTLRSSADEPTMEKQMFKVGRTPEGNAFELAFVVSACMMMRTDWSFFMMMRTD